MPMLKRWIALLTLPLAGFAACSNDSGNGFDDGGNSGSAGDDSGVTGFGPDPTQGTGTFAAGEAGRGTTTAGPCKGGHYGGSFTGTYSSALTVAGAPIPVTGDVNLNLDQEGAAGTQCMLDGEFQDCSTVFSLKNGTISGTADLLFGYYCTMTGTLDCNKKKLVDGWIVCTYCTGPILGDAGAGCPALSREFAGPLTANYDVNMLAFVNGVWNGAEALCPNNTNCNNGTMPGPDGGSIWNYLSDSGVYVGPGDYGGSGMWNATYSRDQ